MQTKETDSQTQQLGEAIIAAYDLSSAVASDRTTAKKLAARHLARVLVHGANERLVAALRELARELAPRRARFAA